MFTQRLNISSQDARMVSTTKVHALGSVAETADGRVWRYASAGAVNLAAGIATVTPAKVANHTNINFAAATAVGSRNVSVTVGATAVTAGQYDGGYLTINDGAGVGVSYLIAGTPAIASAGTGVIQLAEPIVIALTTASRVVLTPSPWGSVIVHPGGASTFYASGFTEGVIPAGNFYWSQTGGMTATLSDGIIAKGTGAVLTANAVPGAIQTEAAANITQRVATAVEATVDTKYYPVFLNLD